MGVIYASLHVNISLLLLSLLVDMLYNYSLCLFCTKMLNSKKTLNRNSVLDTAINLRYNTVSLEEKNDNHHDFQFIKIFFFLKAISHLEASKEKFLSSSEYWILPIKQLKLFFSYLIFLLSIFSSVLQSTLLKPSVYE